MRKILIVIDMQNDFIDGSLGSKEATEIVDGVVNILNQYDIKDIYATLDTHYEDYLNTNEGKHLPVKHCIQGTKGHELNEKLQDKFLIENIFIKNTFGSTALAKHIKNKYLNEENNKEEELEIDLCGLCTDICVISNALLLKAYMPNANICLYENLTAGVTVELKKQAINVLRSCHITII